jgi:hypothetical protein
MKFLKRFFCKQDLTNEYTQRQIVERYAYNKDIIPNRDKIDYFLRKKCKGYMGWDYSRYADREISVSIHGEHQTKFKYYKIDDIVEFWRKDVMIEKR